MAPAGEDDDGDAPRAQALRRRQYSRRELLQFSSSPSAGNLPPGFDPNVWREVMAGGVPIENGRVGVPPHPPGIHGHVDGRGKPHGGAPPHAKEQQYDPNRDLKARGPLLGSPPQTHQHHPQHALQSQAPQGHHHQQYLPQERRPPPGPPQHLDKAQHLQPPHSQHSQQPPLPQSQQHQQHQQQQPPVPPYQQRQQPTQQAPPHGPSHATVALPGAAGVGAGPRMRGVSPEPPGQGPGGAQSQRPEQAQQQVQVQHLYAGKGWGGQAYGRGAGRGRGLVATDKSLQHKSTSASPQIGAPRVPGVPPGPENSVAAAAATATAAEAHASSGPSLRPSSNFSGGAAAGTGVGTDAPAPAISLRPGWRKEETGAHGLARPLPLAVPSSFGQTRGGPPGPGASAAADGGKPAGGPGGWGKEQGPGHGGPHPHPHPQQGQQAVQPRPGHREQQQEGPQGGFYGGGWEEPSFRRPAPGVHARYVPPGAGAGAARRRDSGEEGRGHDGFGPDAPGPPVRKGGATPWDDPTDERREDEMEEARRRREDFERMRQEHHRQAASRRGEGGARKAPDEAPAADAPAGPVSQGVAPKAKAAEEADGEGAEEEILFAPKGVGGAGATSGRPLPASVTASPAPASPAPPRPGSAAATPAPACPPGFKARPLSAASSPQPPLVHGGPASGLPSNGGGAALLEALLQGPAPAKGAPGGTSQEAAGAGGRKVSRALALDDSGTKEKEKEQGEETPAAAASAGWPADGLSHQGAGPGLFGFQGHQAMTLDEVEAGVAGLGSEVGEGSKEAPKETPQGATDSLRNFTSLASWLPSLASPGAAAPEEQAPKSQPSKGGASLVPSTPSFSSWSSSAPSDTAAPATGPPLAPSEALEQAASATAAPEAGEAGAGPAPAGPSSLFGSSLFFPGSIFSWSPAGPSGSATAAAPWGMPSTQATAKGGHGASQGPDSTPTPAPQGNHGTGPAGGAMTGPGAIPLGVSVEHSQQAAKGEQGGNRQAAQQQAGARKGLAASGENGGSTGSLLEILQRYKGDHAPGSTKDQQADTAPQGIPEAQASVEVSAAAAPQGAGEMGAKGAFGDITAHAQAKDESASGHNQASLEAMLAALATRSEKGERDAPGAGAGLEGPGPGGSRPPELARGPLPGVERGGGGEAFLGSAQAESLLGVGGRHLLPMPMSAPSLEEIEGPGGGGEGVRSGRGSELGGAPVLERASREHPGAPGGNWEGHREALQGGPQWQGPGGGAGRGPLLPPPLPASCTSLEEIERLMMSGSGPPVLARGEGAGGEGRRETQSGGSGEPGNQAASMQLLSLLHDSFPGPGMPDLNAGSGAPGPQHLMHLSQGQAPFGLGAQLGVPGGEKVRAEAMGEPFGLSHGARAGQPGSSPAPPLLDAPLLHHGPPHPLLPGMLGIPPGDPMGRMPSEALHMMLLQQGMMQQQQQLQQNGGEGQGHPLDLAGHLPPHMRMPHLPPGAGQPWPMGLPLGAPGDGMLGGPGPRGGLFGQHGGPGQQLGDPGAHLGMGMAPSPPPPFLPGHLPPMPGGPGMWPMPFPHPMQHHQDPHQQQQQQQQQQHQQQQQQLQQEEQHQEQQQQQQQRQQQQHQQQQQMQHHQQQQMHHHLLGFHIPGAPGPGSQMSPAPLFPQPDPFPHPTAAHAAWPEYNPNGLGTEQEQQQGHFPGASKHQVSRSLFPAGMGQENPAGPPLEAVFAPPPLDHWC